MPEHPFYLVWHPVGCLRWKLGLRPNNARDIEQFVPRPYALWMPTCMGHSQSRVQGRGAVLMDNNNNADMFRERAEGATWDSAAALGRRPSPHALYNQMSYCVVVLHQLRRHAGLRGL